MRYLVLRLAEKYEPRRTRMTFSTYATWILTRRVGSDVYRQRLVDTRYHERRAPDLSLDELRERLDRAVAFEEPDDTPDREQSDWLTRLALALSATDVSPREALENWIADLKPQEAAA